MPLLGKSNPRIVTQAVQRQVLKYRGAWVAVDDDTVLAVGPDAKSVAEGARRLGHEHPILLRVPEDGNSHLFAF
jgi:hypothetical protein